MNVRSISAAVLLLAVACSSAQPLSNTHATPEALATALLDALAGVDRGRLEALALSEQEFKDHVWPDLPAARPERNLPFSYVWGDLHQKSQIRLTSTLRASGGQRYVLERVSFNGETVYPHYKVHRQAELHVRDASGAETTLRVCGSMIEKDGAWKVFSYVVDD